MTVKAHLSFLSTTISNNLFLEILGEIIPDPTFNTFKDECSAVDFNLSFRCAVEESPFFGQEDKQKLLESETESDLLRLFQPQYEVSKPQGFSVTTGSKPNELSTTDLKSESVGDEFSTVN